MSCSSLVLPFSEATAELAGCVGEAPVLVVPTRVVVACVVVLDVELLVLNCLLGMLD